MRRAAAIVLATLALVLSACSAGTGKYTTMSPEEVKAFKEEHPNALYVDVRTREEYENIHTCPFGNCIWLPNYIQNQ